MRRTSFFGALAVIAVGAVLAFAIQSSPRQLDLHVTGLIILLAGSADLAIRFILGDSPLLSPDTADVAAVVEPLGEPVLDVFGKPITPTPVRVLQPPPPESLELVGPAVVVPDDTQEMEVVEERPLDADKQEGPQAPTPPEQAWPYENPGTPDQVVRRPGEYEPPESLRPVSILTGRPVRTRRSRRHGR